MSPGTAPRKGGTFILVYGVKFRTRALHHNAILQCRFGGPDYAIDVRVPGNVISFLSTTG